MAWPGVTHHLLKNYMLDYSTWSSGYTAFLAKSASYLVQMTFCPFENSKEQLEASAALGGFSFYRDTVYFMKLFMHTLDFYNCPSVLGKSVSLSLRHFPLRECSLQASLLRPFR